MITKSIAYLGCWAFLIAFFYKLYILFFFVPLEVMGVMGFFVVIGISLHLAAPVLNRQPIKKEVTHD